jgi:hypothetical protein
MPISKHDKQALADLFINMGVPLVTAIQTVESWSGGEGDDVKVRAEKLSKLLGTSVDLATKITKKLEIRDAYTLENVRGKILKIVTPLIADDYIRNGEVTNEETLSNLTEMFDVLLSFSDSVSPTDEKGSKPTKIAMMVEACNPLLIAIRENDMGQGFEETFNECVSGLVKRADELSKPLGLDDPISDGLFKSIVIIFSSCYGKGENLESVWRDCDERLALIYGLTSYVREKAGIELPKKEETKSSRNKEAKADNKKDDKETEDKKNDKADKPDDDGDEDGDDFNPMAFFSSGG